LLVEKGDIHRRGFLGDGEGREMIEKLILNSGKRVGKDEISNPAQLPTA
jgi:hypothetical protein